MSAIVWVTCPSCGYRFYLVEGDVGRSNIWFCPKCKSEFPESDGLAAERRHPGRPTEGWDTHLDTTTAPPGAQSNRR